MSAPSPVAVLGVGMHPWGKWGRPFHEYGVEAAFEQVQVATARWIKCGDVKKLEEFREKNAMNLAIDGAGELVYLAPTRVNLQLAQERAPGVEFMATREQAHVVAAR